MYSDGMHTCRAARTLAYYFMELNPTLHNWLYIYLQENPIPKVCCLCLAPRCRRADHCVCAKLDTPGASLRGPAAFIANCG